MWALRRASNPLKKRVFNIGTSRACCAKSEIARCYLDDKAGIGEAPQVIADRSLSLERLYSTTCDSPKFFMGKHNFSSQAGAKSSGEEDDDLVDGFSELESPASAEAIPESNAVDENEDELICEPELSDGNDEDGGVEEHQNELEFSDTETDVTEKSSPRKRVSLELFKAIMAAPGLSVHSVLDKWVEEGNDLTRAETSLAMLNLRKRRMYGRALQRVAMLRSAGRNVGCTLGFRRWTHAITHPAPLDIAINNHTTVSPPLVLPEIDRNAEKSNTGFGFPSFSFGGGSMELMAVPKRKVSRHKRGIRNGPKALKPIPVIIRCKSCGRVKLPHFYCCSGERGNNGEQNGSTS